MAVYPPDPAGDSGMDFVGGTDAVPTGFTFYHVERFPADSSVSVPVQLTLLDAREEVEGETRFSLSQRDFHAGFHRYVAHHEMKVKMIGKVFGRTFNEFLRPFDFPFYYNEERSLLVVQAPKEISHDFISTLNECRQVDFEANRYEVDISKILPRLPMITGVWVGGLEDQYLKTAGYFGPHVNRASELQAKLLVGQVKTVMIHEPLGPSGDDVRVAITRYGGVVVYTRFEVDEHALDVALTVFDKYVLPTLPTVVTPSRTTLGSQRLDGEDLVP